ncbi:TRAP transporter large permease [Roseomonas sp. KE0001]|uniref:TRAP transporter large permease n=1 Tax=Roseomonas sp. KE0001 TaxID=2479201 RepID=UPI0018DEF6B4|nr:TRAP transporter large permease subunit [Roseomonas sp. KE0001]MBI0433584.1 TRAP transporter large permease subunit [Roseomonas sp. KE0001]
MDLLQLSGLLLLLLGLLLAGGLWIGMALAALGFVAITFVHPQPGTYLASAFWEATGSWTLAALPMFVWMGEILFRTRISEELFSGLSPWVRRIPGRLMHVNVLACGIFGAVSGSSAATCATVSRIALPELRRRGYDDRVAIGSLATSGTLGIMIPPSIIMVVYAVAAETSVVRVFLAGFLPGLLVMGLFSAYIAVWALLNPSRQPPREPSTSLLEKLRQSSQLIPCVLLILAVIGSMFAGWATATEAAACGVAGALALAAATRCLTWKSFIVSLTGATRVSCMIMFILAGAAYLTKAMALTGIPAALAEAVAAMNLGPYGLIAMLTIIYIILGMALDGVSMIVLTTTIVVPMVQHAGFDLVWFGIFIVLLVEMAQITPPVGFNLFVMQSMTGREQTEVAWATLPFFLMLVLAVALVTVFPAIATWLPDVLLSR